jgi:hypothetical protein
MKRFIQRTDGFTTVQDVPDVIAVRGNGSTVQGFLDNEQVSGRRQKRSCLRPKTSGYRAKKLLKSKELGKPSAKHKQLRLFGLASTKWLQKIAPLIPPRRESLKGTLFNA